MTIVTEAEFVAYLGSEIQGNRPDLVASLNAAEQAIQHHCRRAFSAPATSATARIYEPTSSVVLEVDDLSDITGLIVDNDGVIVAAPDYQLEPLNGLVYGMPAPYTTIRLLTGAWASQVTVTAKWGHVPADVAEACRVLAKDIAGLRDTRFGVAGWGEFGVVRMRENPQVVALLAPHVRWDRAGIA